MKVLIGNSISFEENLIGESFAMISGDYRIEEMTPEQFEEWADTTNDDWITEEYEGEIYLSKYVTKETLFHGE